MKYTVVWSNSALNELANLWMNAVDRNSVALASDAIDRMLAHRPKDAGERINEQDWLLHAAPLMVDFVVSDEDCLVRVHAVWLKP